MRKVIFLTAFAIVGAAASCGEPLDGELPCNAETCPTGCCLGSSCMQGLSAQACGSEGQTCINCTAGGGRCEATTQQCAMIDGSQVKIPDKPQKPSPPAPQSGGGCAPDCAGKCKGSSDGCGGVCSTSQCGGCCWGTTCHLGTADNACGKLGLTAKADGSCWTCPSAFQGCKWRCNPATFTCEKQVSSCK